MIARRILSSKRFTRIAPIVGAGLVAMLAPVCLFFRVSKLADVVAYWGMSQECHPVWKEFAFRRVKKGDSADEFLRQFTPSDRSVSGRDQVYIYYDHPLAAGLPMTWFSVTARDGRLLRAQAGSCTWEFTFFSE